MLIRKASDADLPSILEIYNEVIFNSAAIYADDPVSIENRKAWFERQKQRRFPVLAAVHLVDGVVGFSTFGDWRGTWPGYRHTVEHSVHIRHDHRGAGIGRKLVEALFPHASHLGMHVMIGGIDASNASSLRLHESLGFQRVAHFRQVGKKFGH
jgi:L-amino acid N-acyltransferase